MSQFRLESNGTPTGSTRLGFLIVRARTVPGQANKGLIVE